MLAVIIHLSQEEEELKYPRLILELEFGRMDKIETTILVEPTHAL
jgi:hypothetical protein